MLVADSDATRTGRYWGNYRGHELGQVVGLWPFSAAHVPVGMAVDASFNAYGSFIDNGYPGAGVIGGHQSWQQYGPFYLRLRGGPQDPAGSNDGQAMPPHSPIRPASPWTCASDDVYVADNGNNSVRKITPTAGGTRRHPADRLDAGGLVRRPRIG